MTRAAWLAQVLRAAGHAPSIAGPLVEDAAPYPLPPKGIEVLPLEAVDDIEGALLIVHGLIDENVHFRHAARMINALVKARKRHELLLFPDERHMPRSEADRVYMEERLRDFFLEQLDSDRAMVR